MRYWSFAPTLTSGETFSSSRTWIMWLTVSAPSGECSVSKTSQSKGSPWRMSLTSGFPIVTHAPYETPRDSFLLRLLFVLSLYSVSVSETTSAMSFTRSWVSPVVFAASSNIVMQKGQATERMLAPVSFASSILITPIFFLSGT